MKYSSEQEVVDTKNQSIQVCLKFLCDFPPSGTDVVNFVSSLKSIMTHLPFNFNEMKNKVPEPHFPLANSIIAVSLHARLGTGDQNESDI